jgi:MFS family permease
VDVSAQDLPQGVTRAKLPASVWLLGWVSFFTDLASEAIYPLLPLFLTRVLGAGAMSLGVIEGAAEAANSALKIISGRLSDRWNARKPLVLFGYSLSSTVRPLMALAASWLHVLALRFTDRLGKGIRGAPRDALLARITPPGQRGQVFGIQRAMDHAGAVAGPLLASAFLWFRPEDYRTLFALTILPGIVVVVLLTRLKDDRVAPPTGGKAQPTLTGWRNLPGRLWVLLGILFIFTLGNASDAFILLRLSDIGVGAAWIPIIWSALHVVKSISSAVGGTWSDRVGRRRLIAAGWVLYALVYFAFARFDGRAAVIGIFMVYGLYFGLTEGAERALITDLTPDGLRGTAFGLYNAALGVGALVASVLFGLVWTEVSPDAAFLMGGALALLAAVLLVFVPAPAEPRARPV